jgi:hypothetical protein
MTNYLPLAAVALLVIVAVLQLLMLLRKDKPLRQTLASLEESSAKTEQALRDEVAQLLAEAQAFRQEVTEKFADLMKLMVPASTVTRKIDEKLDRVRDVVEQRLQAMLEQSGQKLDQAGEKSLAVANGQRQESALAIEKAKESIIALLDQYTKYQNQALNQSLAEQINQQRAQVAAFTEQQRGQLAALAEQLNRIAARVTESTEQNLQLHRTEVDARLKRMQAEVAVVAKFSSATHAYGVALGHEFNGAAEATAPAGKLEPATGPRPARNAAGGS